MNEIVIKTNQLARNYQTYCKETGLIAAMKGLFSKTSETKHALLPIDLEITRGQIVGLVGSKG